MYGHKRVRERRHDALARVGWEQLEVLLATWYRGQGYEVEHTGTGASGSKYDGGIDLKLRRPGEYLLVQVKHWNAYKVPHNDVHQLLGLMVNEGATGAILVTSGEFTKAAIEAATRHGHVRLIDGDELRAMLGPLPESAPPPSTLAPIAARAGERLLLAAEDRIRHGGRRSRRAVEVGIGLALAKGVFALVAMVFIVLTFNSVVRSVGASLQPRPAHSAQRTQSIAKPVAASPAATARTGSQSRACEELIDKASGTYIDHCAQASPRRAPTAAEIRESQLKANEAMRVLAPNTPEM
ncbi:MAG TPA: restriction endonuclease [Xanthomonadaceae bacterium]|nr:restriction endonuclease [Xanthomonadaceae bacterium]